MLRDATLVGPLANSKHRQVGDSRMLRRNGPSRNGMGRR